jgi:type IV pilus assembly protein PilE
MQTTAQIGKIDTMNTANRKRNSGFTIIELMIVLVIVAILLAIAYPSYVNYVRKANRGEAQQILLNWSINQEIWRSNNTSYATAAGIPLPTHDKFTFTIDNVSATTYLLQARADGDQAKDKARDGTPCGATGSLMTIDQNGVKSPAGCWE